MAKVRWTEARWAKRAQKAGAQKARVLANNTPTPVRRRMMLEMAEFYDRLAELTRDFKTGSRLAQRRERGKVPGGVVRPLVGAKPGTLPIERKRPAGVPRTAKRPQGKRRTSPQTPTCGCVLGKDWSRGTLANDQVPATLEV